MNTKKERSFLVAMKESGHKSISMIGKIVWSLIKSQQLIIGKLFKGLSKECGSEGTGYPNMIWLLNPTPKLRKTGNP